MSEEMTGEMTTGEAKQNNKKLLGKVALGILFALVVVGAL
jgi:hypothetical protein